MNFRSFLNLKYEFDNFFSLSVRVVCKMGERAIKNIPAKYIFRWSDKFSVCLIYSIIRYGISIFDQRMKRKRKIVENRKLNQSLKYTWKPLPVVYGIGSINLKTKTERKTNSIKNAKLNLKKIPNNNFFLSKSIIFHAWIKMICFFPIKSSSRTQFHLSSSKWNLDFCHLTDTLSIFDLCADKYIYVDF